MVELNGCKISINGQFARHCNKKLPKVVEKPPVFNFKSKTNKKKTKKKNTLITVVSRSFCILELCMATRQHNPVMHTIYQQTHHLLFPSF